VSATEVSLDLVRELRAICGEEYVTERTSPAHQPIAEDTVDLDKSALRPSSSISVAPGCSEEVAAILRLANDRAFGVTPVGWAADTLGPFGPTGVLLHINRLTHVEHYDHADLTVGVGAGMTVAQLNTMVGADKLMFACDPPLPKRATIGGVLAAAKQGPLRHGYGAVRDFCIGMRFVTGDGRKAKGGGRVVKNVAGYDLMKLLIGSYGTLAVITSASFKLFPAPRQTRTFLAEFATWQGALKFRDLVLRSPLSPMCLELVSPGLRKLMRPEVTHDAWVICVRGSGSDAVLARYRRELGSAVTRELDGDDEAKMWRAIEDFPRSLPIRSFTADRWCYAIINVPISEVGAAIRVLEEFATPDGMGLITIGRVGVGVLLVAYRASAADMMAKVVEAIARQISRDCSIRQHGPGKVFPLTPTHLPSMRAVKRALDPNNVLPGKELF
jgi:glycolate oxidase FAD binding subunit